MIQPSKPGMTLAFSPACERNKGPILAVLRDWLPTTGTILEVASGTGQHALHFAAGLPGVVWQPTDPSPSALDAIRERREAAALPNLRAPIALDAAFEGWPIEGLASLGAIDAIVCINMAHISPWEATLGVLSQAAQRLPQGGTLYFYGPWLRDGVETAPGNVAFDQDLRSRDPRWGLRSVQALSEAATPLGLAIVALVEMPANNLSIVLRKEGRS